jgi:hypothetical protein
MEERAMKRILNAGNGPEKHKKDSVSSLSLKGIGLWIFLAGAGFAGSAQAEIPMFNASCPHGIEVHADKGGPIFINGKNTKITTSNRNYYEANRHEVTVSVSINADGSPSVSFTGSGGANGMCKVTSFAANESGGHGGGSEAIDVRGNGTIIGGGATSGHLFRGRHGKYALLINATANGFTCSGLMNEPPGTRKSMTVSLSCTDGATGNASILKNRSGSGYSVIFNLSSGNNGNVLFKL